MVYPLHCLCLTIALAGQAPEQDSASSVAGQIRSDKGRPVAGALVRGMGSKVVPRSDAQGRFDLHGLAFGPAHLQVQALGFEPLDTTVTLRRAERLVWKVVDRKSVV